MSCLLSLGINGYGYPMNEYSFLSVYSGISCVTSNFNEFQAIKWSETLSQNTNKNLGMGLHACNSSTWETETEGLLLL